MKQSVSESGDNNRGGLLSQDNGYSLDGRLALVNIDNAAEYLIARGSLDTKSIIEGDLKIVDASRRNRNLHIIRKNDVSLLIKQPSSTDINNTVTVKKEALLYLLMQTDPDFASLKEIAPRILDFDETRNILITEFIPNAESWNDHNYYLSSYGRGEVIRKEESAELGRLMATYHKAFSRLAAGAASGNSRLRFLQGGFVPAASIVRPGSEILTDISSANLKLLKIIQQYPAFYDALEELYSSWRPQTLVHGDIKWDNIIISQREKGVGGEEGEGHRNFKMNIVDWESASIGDPAWDVGSTFQEFIKFWLSFMPGTGLESAKELIASASRPIKDIQPAIRAFWSAYVKYSGLIDSSAAEANELLTRSAKLCAARLVQSAYESLYSSIELSNTVVYMVQTSMNIFSRPGHAVTHLLGIPFRGELEKA